MSTLHMFEIHNSKHRMADQPSESGENLGAMLRVFSSRDCRGSYHVLYGFYVETKLAH